MDLITHTISGIAVGTVAASFIEKGALKKTGVILIGGLGGALPDIDAISLWSKFDATIGAPLNLDHTGKEIYFSKFWYSHHAFMHSLFAGLALALIAGCIINFKRFQNKSKQSHKGLKRMVLPSLSFLGGYLIHLLEDMPTPASVWGGVNFLWPSKSYVGGTGDIWWWNNYDLFLIIASVILLNLLCFFLNLWVKPNLKRIPIFIFLLGASLFVFQVKTRQFDFNYTGFSSKYNEYELKSKEIQKEILGEKIYQLMVKLDNSIPLYF